MMRSLIDRNHQSEAFLFTSGLMDLAQAKAQGVGRRRVRRIGRPDPNPGPIDAWGAEAEQRKAPKTAHAASGLFVWTCGPRQIEQLISRVPSGLGALGEERQANCP
jgi:hypothetical protein